MHDPVTDAVVLVPGFLGFSRVGQFYYFAERVIATLRGALEARLERCVPVVPCRTQPTHGLAARQQFLLERIFTLDDKLRGVRRIHLVGHSTGGLDAELLTRDKPLSGDSWGPYAEVREKIASVTTLAAPLLGTSLATSSVAKFLQEPLRNLRDAPDAVSLLKRLAALVPRVQASADVAAGVLSSYPETMKFFFDVLRHHALIGDLAPSAVAQLREERRPQGHVQWTSFVTVTPAMADVEARADPFFLALRSIIAAYALQGASRAIHENVALLRSRAEEAIRAPDVAPPEIDPSMSDGIVDSARQIVDAGRPDQLGCIVVADHADVLGHYDRKDAQIESKPLNASLFRSGSSFGDDEFFKLYQRVAAGIVRAVPGARADTRARAAAA
jgi:pimeloyl-ACP methyl ester carboxylesterase